jgi:hypothetical protein
MANSLYSLNALTMAGKASSALICHTDFHTAAPSGCLSAVRFPCDEMCISQKIKSALVIPVPLNA